MILILAAPAAGASARHDSVIAVPSAGSARISAAAPAVRYPIEDGSGETVAIAVTADCSATCDAVEPRQIASFLGTLIHGPEMSLVTVQLDTPTQIEFDCGYGAQACYYSSENRIVISGNGSLAPDGATREMVLAHEYGHHVARHRATPSPFPAAIDWGTARWSSYEHVCQGSRAGSFFPGDEGLHYFQDPGEAFAEAFAHYRFPESGVPWRWIAALEPDVDAFAAIREDVLAPWSGRTGLELSGRMPPRRRGAALRSFNTPLDGLVSLRPSGRGRDYSLDLLNPAGRLLRTAGSRLGGRPRLNFTICGQQRLRVALQSSGARSSAYQLQIQRP